MKNLILQINEPLIGLLNVSLDKRMSVLDNSHLQSQVQDKVREVILKVLEANQSMSEIDTLSK